MRLRHISLAVLALSVLVRTTAAGQNVSFGKMLNYRQTASPQGTTHFLFSTYYFNEKTAYNLKGFETGRASGQIISMKYSPVGTSYAVLTDHRGKRSVEIFDPRQVGKPVRQLQDISAPVALCYAADGKHLFVADAAAGLKKLEAKDFTLAGTYPLPLSAPHLLAASSNGYHLLAAVGRQVAVINCETGSLRTTIELGADIRDAAFSSDASMLGVATADGTLAVYDTRSFQRSHELTGLGDIRGLAFHPEGKYVTLLTGSSNILFLNLMDARDRTLLPESEGGIAFPRYIRDGKKQIYLSYTTPSSIKYKQLRGLQPNLNRLLSEELSARMSEWAKRRPDESEEEYLVRVSEEGRQQQALLFEQEIATRMADDLVKQSTVTLGSYNHETSILTMNFDNMAPVYLTVPEEELASFADMEDIEFRDVIYGLTEDDHFEITFAHVYNKRTGKTYEFNNLQRRSLDFLTSDDNFVPIELVQQSSLEDVKLQAIKDEVVNTAKQQSLLSDHTHISVNTRVFADYDADGRRITNSQISFNYTVEGQYSAQEDFAAGKYVISQSHAAISMLEIVKRAFAEDFAQYIRPGKKLKVKVTGSADALRINGVIAYDGSYGDFEDEPYFLDDERNAMTVTRKSGIRQNEQLAFLRAAGVKDYIQKQITSLGQMAVDYESHIELSDQAGGEFRRIGVEFIFIDAFNPE